MPRMFKGSLGTLASAESRGMTDALQLTGARWSNASRCSRMAAYDVTGAIPQAPTGRVIGLFQRGHDVEEAFFRDHPELGPIARQHEVEWGAGWHAHVDGVLTETDPPEYVEVKSTTSIDTLPGCTVTVDGMTSKSSAIQVAGAAHLDGRGGTASVIAVSPVDYEWHEWPVNVEALAPLVDAISAQVVQAAETGELPERQCQRPTDAIGRHCPYAAACFADWEEPDAIILDGERARLSDLLLEADEALAADAAALAESKAVRDDLRDQLRPLLEPRADHWTSHARVRVTPVAARKTFKLGDALAAGVLSEDEAEPFVKVGAESERWLVERIGTSEQENAA